MTETRPTLAADRPSDRAPVEALLADFTAAFPARDADLFDGRLAEDVLWGSPFGAVLDGWGPLNEIHRRQFEALPEDPAAAGATSRYEIEHVRRPTDGVVVAYVRRIAAGSNPSGPDPAVPATFDELALIVLVERDGRWWVAAAQHVPDRRVEVYGAAL